MKLTDLLKHRYVHFTAAAVVIAAGAIFGHEGLVLSVYPDPATKGAPWTYCYGLTDDPKFGHQYTVVECQDETLPTIQRFAVAVDDGLTRKIPDKTASSFVDFAYNVGVPAFRKSTLLRKANAGDLVGACDELLKWTKAAGKVMKGLVLRRGDERDLCLAGVKEGVAA